MSQALKLHSHHIINNFPKDSSFFKRLISQLAFLIMVTKVVRRKNYLNQTDYQEATPLIKKGDVILVGGFRSVSGIFLGKLFTHSLLYKGDGECIDASIDGVDTARFVDLFDEYDNLAILRPRIIENIDLIINKTIEYATEQLGKPYDFFFENINDRHYCTLLINTAFSRAGFDTGVKFRKTATRPSLLTRLRKVTKASSFLYGNFDLIYLSGSLKDQKDEITKMNNIIIEK
jgi:uncharacterized protein YycO